MRSRTAIADPFRVAVIAFDGITSFHLSVPCLIFGSRHTGTHGPAFDVKVCAQEQGMLSTASGFDIAVHHDLSGMDGAGIVVMPSWYDDCRDAPEPLIRALRKASQRGAIVLGLCLGAFPLAQAGLLDGRVATTHWAFADTLAERYPHVNVDSDVLYVDEGNVLTSAGVAAGLDCSLHLVRRICGADVANRIARQCVIAPHRQGGQAQFIERPLPVSAGESRVADVLSWVSGNLAQAHGIDALARRAAMSRRNFTRHFRQATGMSFKQWLLNQRLAHAQHMLESSDVSIELLAHQAGFGSALSLRQHFRAAFCTSPSAYRKLFRANDEGGTPLR